VFLVIVVGITFIYELLFSNPGQIILDVESHMWRIVRRGLALDCVIVPLAIFVAQKTGQLTIRGLVLITLFFSISISILNFWNLDQLGAPYSESKLLSIEGLIGYDYWPVSLAGIIGFTLVTVIAYFVVNHLTRRLSRTRKRAA